MSRLLRLVSALLCVLLLAAPVSVSVFADGEGDECEEHVWGDWEEVRPATCGEDGEKIRRCTVCGAEETEVIPATGEHIWGSWKTEKEPSYWEEGADKRVCLICEAEETLILPMLDNPFKDVKLDRWYARPVLFCYDNGYMVGVSAENFSLSDPVSRAMIVQIMARLAGVDLTDPAYNRSEFTDVATGRWYTRAIEWARANGMAAGTGGGYFSPDASITRQELAVFLYRLTAYVKGEDQPYDLSAIADYRDRGELAGWAARQMSWAIAEGVMHGTTPYHLSPRITLTRAQVAEFVYAAHNYFEY